jgi:hypothetical protein
MVYYPENVFGKQIFSSNNGNVFTNFALLCIKRDPPPEIPLPSIADAIWRGEWFAYTHKSVL